MRDALYKKSLELAVSDFRTFGTASVTTRTVSDITNIQTALVNTVMLVLPVPFVFVLSIVMAFRLDWAMGLILLAILIVIMIIAVFIIKSSSPLFRKLQKLLDKISSVLLENIKELEGGFRKAGSDSQTHRHSRGILHRQGP